MTLKQLQLQRISIKEQIKRISEDLILNEKMINNYKLKTTCNMGEDLGEREITDEQRLRMRF